MKRWVFSLVVVVLLFWLGSVSASETLNKAKADYDHQLDLYRANYDEFVLKRTQFENTSSFANQESMVLSAKQMLLDRAQVWRAYWQALRMDVLETEGLADEKQTEIEGTLLAFDHWLDEYINDLNNIESKDPLLAKAMQLNDMDAEYKNMSYQVLAELKMSRFSWSVLQLQLFHDRLKPVIEIQIRDMQERQLRMRGLDEVDSILSYLKEQVDEIRGDTDKRERTRDFEDYYDDTVEDLSPIYSDLIRSYSLLEEISEGTEL